MKPFDLERALAGDPVITRSGLKVLEIHHFKKSTNKKVWALIENNEIRSFYENGKYYSCREETAYDLFMAPVKRKAWIAVYETEGEPYQHCSSVYFEKKDLEDHLIDLGKRIDLPKFQIIEIELEV